jgi:hypothetical protein
MSVALNVSGGLPCFAASVEFTGCHRIRAEIAIRMALARTPIGVAPLAARGCLYDLDGGGIGLIIALALACVISTMLFLVFKPGWCDLLGNAVAACRHHIDAISIPTRRAIRVDRSLLCEVIARSPRLVQHITHRIVEISV